MLPIELQISGEIQMNLRTFVGLGLLALVSTGAQASAATLVTHWNCQNSHAHIIGGYKYSMVCKTSTGWLGNANHTATHCDLSRKVIGPSAAQGVEGLLVGADSSFKVDAWDIVVHLDQAAKSATIKSGDFSVAVCSEVAEADFVAVSGETEN